MSSILDVLDAAEKGDYARLSSLLNDGADPNTKDHRYHGVTALMLASKEGHRMCIELLITKGASLDEKDDGGNTALMWATWQNKRECMECIRHLIQNGADTTAMNSNGKTAMDLVGMLAEDEDLSDSPVLQETREILRRAPQIRRYFLDAQRRQAGTSSGAAVESLVAPLEARLRALEAELAEERRALAEVRRDLAAEQSARAGEREKWGIETCTICHDRATETRFLECAHSCACEQCAAELLERGAACPLCRSAIRDVRALVIRAEIRDAEAMVGRGP